jgi:hypothetical protein
MERIFYLFTEGDSRRVKSMLQEFESKKGIQIEEGLHKKVRSNNLN